MTLRLLIDEDVPSSIIRALRRQIPQLDVTRVQDAGLRGASDDVVLQWAADARRITLTCDRSTMIDAAVRRLHEREGMPGLVVVRRDAPSKRVIEDLQLIVSAMDDSEWVGQIGFVPL